jgi:NAD(P)-dependent dehydrogenase (short-subunit alcohol dehydrogenase family)
MAIRLGLDFVLRPRLPSQQFYHKWTYLHNTHRTMSTHRRRDLPLHANAENCSGRTFIVTGANTGLGFEATKHLVAAGAAKVVMAVRNVSSGEDAKAKIEAELGSTSVAQVWPLDLASYASVKAFASKATAELDRVDALIENAGVFDFKRILSEGHLNTVTVNIISTFLLASLMLPKLVKTARDFEGVVPHLTVVGSSYGFSGQKDWDSVKDDPLVKMDAEQNNLPRL